MKDFIIYWRDGKHDVVSGETIASAFTRAGFGAGAMAVVDFYEESKIPTYEFEGGMWVKIEE